MLVNTAEEMEEKALKQLRMTLKRVFAICPLIRYRSLSSPVSSSALPCIEWLNQHPPNSILYISFGSQNSIHPSQMTELAQGLEAFEKAFIWAIRPPINFDTKDVEFSPKWLPEGFKDRMAETEGINGEKLGTPNGNSLSPIDGCVSKPLWVEFYNRELELQCSDLRVAAVV